jgi:hypothetical protein
MRLRLPLKTASVEFGWIKPRTMIRNEETWPDKARGRLLSRDDRPLSFRFFEDLVRFPDHNKVISKSVVSRELGPRFSSRFRCYLVVRVSPIQFSILVAESVEGRRYSLLLEDCSSVEVIVVDYTPEATGSETFWIVEMMYLLWKWPNEPSIRCPCVLT